jgi:hypothetical protein
LIFIRCLEGISGIQPGLIEKTDPDTFSETIRQAVFKKALKEFYFLRGWDRKARPKIEKLEELGIEIKFVDKYKWLLAEFILKALHI